MKLQNIYSYISYILVIIGLLISLNYMRKLETDINSIFNWLFIIILTIGLIVCIVMISKMSIPLDLVSKYNTTQNGIRTIFIIITLITYISFVQIPIKNLVNKKIIIKKGIPGEKGLRGYRGTKGKDGICDSCNDSSLCYKKLMYNITLTLNWWKKNIDNSPQYPSSYIIQNEYLKSKIKQHCKSEELSKIFNKYGANNNDTNICPNGLSPCGSYDYMYRMWSIWILIILKYDKGLFFIETEHLDENDFINMITDIDDRNNDNRIDDWNKMFIKDESSNLLIKNIYSNKNFEVSDYGSNSGDSPTPSLNPTFFTTKGVPNNNYTPFDEIKKYNSWYWGGNKKSKPKIKIVPNNNTDDNNLKRESCGNDENDKKPNIKIKKSNNFYKLFSSDNTWQKDYDGLLTPFKLLGKQNVTFMRSHEFIDEDAHYTYRTYKPVGDLLFNSSEIKKYPFESDTCEPNNIKYFDNNIERLVESNISTILVTGDVKPPKSYRLVYKYKVIKGINKNITNLSIWEPLPPTNYRALGYVISTLPYNTTPTMPSLDLVWCVPKDITTKITVGIDTEIIWSPLCSNSESTLFSCRDTKGGKINNINFNKIRENNDNDYKLNIFKSSIDKFYKLKTESELKKMDKLCIDFDPYDLTKDSTKSIFDECNIIDNNDDCNKNTKCEYLNNKCKYKKRKNEESKKYSIMKIYE